MARPLRIEFSGALYHVMSRGNERKAIVRDDIDREKWIDWLRRTVETYGWRLHAFVLMDSRVDDLSRAAAAYIARRRFGYAVREIASALGYNSHGGVHNAIKRIENNSDTIKQNIEKLIRKLH